MPSHIRKVYACLAVTCHLHFWQNDRDLLRATAVTWGWNGYRNKSQHRKSTLEKKILPPLQQGFEPATFQSRVRRSNNWAIPTELSPWCVFSLFRYPFHPRVTAVAHKRPRSFCQKRRWQVTAKHAYTLRMWLCMKWHGAWLYGVHRTRRDWLSLAADSCGTSHASAVSTPLRWIFKNAL